ncbi:hypothetical protein [Mesorhizobium sp.]|uniref:hypothetical protein n=1 Tax=Mesorhizobium sp. TaxID=1871066 RepID=UPI000FE58995|nr:hypothetical protein [Mesorhizobium sp.]RWP29078.1 MAG: hypothetical protein EOR02_17740 [Mesorhizobium sp.]
MSQLVTNPAQVEANAVRFEGELAASAELQERLSYARAWYAFPRDRGGWRYVPSKFGGYKGMTAAEYLDDSPRNGRRTEKQLGQWFVEVSEDDELHDELYDGLVDLLDTYDKAPSTAARISILAEAYQNREDEPNEEDSTIVDLILLVAKKLPRNELERLRKAL